MEKRKLLIDCDPGHDDAIALVLAFAHKEFEILGITTESGNQTVDKTTVNAINLCCFLGREDIPVVKGLSRPIIKEPLICPEIHGESGLDGFTFPKYSKKSLDCNPIRFITDTIMDNDDVTIVATGALTNIALAIRTQPEILNHVREIVLMGGTTDIGNVTPAAEFNILCDPEAAHIVFNCGAKVSMIGLNVTRQVLVLESVIKRMEKIGNKVSGMFADLMRVFNQNQQKTFGVIAGPLHDPVTIVSLIDPSVVKFVPMNVDIDISHGPSYGRTNCDITSYLGQKHNCNVAMGIDVEKYWDIIEQDLRSYS